MAEGTINFTKKRKLNVLLLFSFLSSVLFYACSSSGTSISTASDESPQEVVEDTTDTSDEDQEAEDLEQRRKELEQLYIEELEERYQGRANSVTTYYTNAQRFFYMRNYRAALYHINKASEIQETSDILALRGSIYLALGSRQKFTNDWTMALDMDKNVPIPNVDFVIKELKAQGLINQNYKPGN